MVPELAKGMAIKGLALVWDVHPETPLSADGTGPLNDETKDIDQVGWRREIDVPSRHIGRTVILQWEQIDLA